jgi:hypothetical protein
MEPGKGQLRGTAAATWSRGSFEHLDRQAGASEHERGRQPVRTGSDNDGVRFVHEASKLEHE